MAAGKDAASLWNVTIENGLGRQDFSAHPRLLRRRLLLLENGYEELAVTGAHVVVVDLLPPRVTRDRSAGAYPAGTYSSTESGEALDLLYARRS